MGPLADWFRVWGFGFTIEPLVLKIAHEEEDLHLQLRCRLRGKEAPPALPGIRWKEAPPALPEGHKRTPNPALVSQNRGLSSKSTGGLLLSFNGCWEHDELRVSTCQQPRNGFSERGVGRGQGEN